MEGIDAVIEERPRQKDLNCGEMSSLYLQKDEGVEADKRVGFDALNLVLIYWQKLTRGPTTKCDCKSLFYFPYSTIEKEKEEKKSFVKL